MSRQILTRSSKARRPEIQWLEGQTEVCSICKRIYHSTKLIKLLELILRIENHKFSNNIYLFCHMTSGSASKSLMSTAFRFATTSGWGVVKSQPTWAKKKPLFALWGSASVSLYLWCTLWSNAHAYTCFCRWKVFVNRLEIVEHLGKLKRNNYIATFEFFLEIC